MKNTTWKSGKVLFYSLETSYSTTKKHALILQLNAQLLGKQLKYSDIGKQV